MAKTVYYGCPYCKKKGVRWDNREAVIKARKAGRVAYKHFRCRYCGHLDHYRTQPA